MNFIFLILRIQFAIILFQTELAFGFSNILSEIFDDLRIGTLDKDYLRQKLDNSKLKCLQGSHFFNGSCYVISNKKYTDTSSLFETDILIDLLRKRSNKNKYLASSLDTVASLNTANTLSTLPLEANWKKALNSCAEINNDSSLIYFDNDNEFAYLRTFLINLNFPDLLQPHADDQSNLNKNIYNEEQKYFIGLTYNNSVWKWITDANISDSLIEKYSLDKITYDNYRKCAYLNIRDNGDVKIELTNCNNEKQPFICKYVLDRCFNNTVCGQNGECINRPSKKTFECRCRIFYDGDKCQNWSSQGIQMLICVSLVIVAFLAVILVKIMNQITYKCTNRREKLFENDEKSNRFPMNGKGLDQTSFLPLLALKQESLVIIQTNPFKFLLNLAKRKIKLFLLIITSLFTAFLFILTVSFIRYKMINYRIEKYQSQFTTNNQQPSGGGVEQKNKIEEIDYKPSKFTHILSYDICQLINDQFVEDYILIFFSFPLTVAIYFWNAYKCQKDHEYNCKFGKIMIKRKNREKSLSSHLSTDNNLSDESQLSSIENSSLSVNVNEKEKSLESIESTINKNHRLSSVQNFCFMCSTLARYLRLNKLKKFTMCTLCGFMCSCNFKLPVPISPFSKRNRFITGVIYAAYTYNILKIFEYLIVGDQHIQTSNKLMEKAKQILNDNTTFSNLSVAKINQQIDDVTHAISNFAERGILVDLLKQICNVIIIGLRYYPVLLCVELKRKSKFCYFITTLYVLFLLTSYIYMNIFCLLSASSAIKEATSQQNKQSIVSKLTLPLVDSSNTPSELTQARMMPPASFILANYSNENKTFLSNNNNNNKKVPSAMSNIRNRRNNNLDILNSEYNIDETNPSYSSDYDESLTKQLRSSSSSSSSQPPDKPYQYTIKSPPFILKSIQDSPYPFHISSNLNIYQKSKLKVNTENLISIEINNDTNNNNNNNKLNNRFKLNSSDLESIKNNLFLYNIMYEKFLFYAVLCLIAFNMLFEFLILIKESICRLIKKCKPKKNVNDEKISNFNKDNNKNNKTKIINETIIMKFNLEHMKKISKYSNEIAYTNQLFKSNNMSNRSISFLKYMFEKYIYKNHRYFRFSKQFINTQIIAFILLYYITCIIIRKSKLIVNLSSNFLILIINFIFKTNSSSESSSFIINSKAQLNLLIQSLFDHISNDIVIACCLTSGIYLFQLFISVRNYQQNVLNAYKGVYIHIPSPKSFSNTKLASSSLHFSGYAIGYLLWGYLILFEVIVIIIIIIKFLIKFYFITENLAKVILPILTIFLFKRIIIWYLSRFFLTSRSQHGFALRNHKLYFILNHFNFFFDCFLGSFVCFVRMAKSSMAALFYMPRLDYSIFGRHLERTDMGFISYVTFIHMEVNQTHPVKLTFCEYLKYSIKSRYFASNNDSYNKKARNKWFLAITLSKHPFLKKQRKNYLMKERSMQKVESFEQFIERRVRILFNYADTKRKSQSTPCLFEESTTNSNSKNDLFNNLEDFRKITVKQNFTPQSPSLAQSQSPPPPPPRLPPKRKELFPNISKN